MSLKLSEAIRLGAKLKPQGYGSSGMYGEVTCALGAAADAINLPEAQDRYDTLCVPFPVLTERLQGCPACHLLANAPSVLRTIYHLNDYHEWTRERIADWVASIEPQEATEPEQQPQAEEAIK